MGPTRLPTAILASPIVAGLMIRNAIFGLATLTTMSQLANADNFWVRPAPSAINWSGFYVGMNAGYGWARSSSSVTPTSGGAPLSNSGDLNAFIGGGQIGYNWQTSNFLLGLEADFQASPQKETSAFNCGVGCTLTEANSFHWFGTTRGRIGYAYDRLMFYGTGGAAWTRVSDALSGNASSSNISTSNSNFGWTLGGGVEWMTSERWSVKFEYLYIWQNALNGTGMLPPFLGGASVTEAVKFNNSVVRVGVNYHF